MLSSDAYVCVSPLGKPHLANIHFMCVFACCGSVGGEDGGAVAVGIVVDQGNGFVQTLGLQDDQHRPEDLLSVARHVRLGRTAQYSVSHNSLASLSTH